jgi:hypothetical protein
MALPREIAEQQARCDEYNKELEEPHFENELSYLEHLWRDPTQPHRLRFMAAKACADFHFPSLRAVAHVTNRDSFAVSLDKARERSDLVRNVIKLEVVPKALEHSASELRPAPGSAENSGGFRRRF